MDARALTWTLDVLDEDHEMEQFAAGIPGLFVSKAVENQRDPRIDMKIKLDADVLRPSSAHDWTPLINTRPPSRRQTGYAK
ncbi:hypothetical protein BGY98DRAFT_1096198 [Russula aff. rugulosa BPL654]|nr:hypothetical protein BGY98DRAFT_1096198 [Russula aff. rugulosa BPL654]